MDKRKKNLNKYSIIFLLAGNGKRIKDITKNPKCLLKINNKTIIDRNLSLLKELKIRNVTLVLGFKNNLIKKEIAKHKLNFNFSFVYNKNYNRCGNSYSLLQGLKSVCTKSLIFDGDLVFSKKILENFLIYGQKSSFLIGKTSIKDVECAKALIDKNGFVRKTIDKRPIYKHELKNYKFIGEAVGILKVSNKIGKLMIEGLKIFLKNKKNLILNWEHFMNEFLINNKIMYNVTLNSQWIEIDTKKDYLRAVSLFKNK